MKIPLFPLDMVLFPGAALPLHIFEEKYKEMIALCTERQQPFGIVRAQREGLAVIGCTARIVTVLNRYSDGRLDILCEGDQRFEIELLDTSRNFLQAEVDFIHDKGNESTRAEREQCAALHFEVLELAGAEDGHATPLNLGLDLDRPIAFQLAWALPSDLNFKQMLLGTLSDAERTARLLEFYNATLPKLRRGVHANKTAARNGHVM